MLSPLLSVCASDSSTRRLLMRRASAVFYVPQRFQDRQRAAMSSNSMASALYWSSSAIKRVETCFTILKKLCCPGGVAPQVGRGRLYADGECLRPIGSVLPRSIAPTTESASGRRPHSAMISFADAGISSIRIS